MSASHSQTQHTVGLLAPNGNVGSAILSALLEPSHLSKINLVVLHRPGSAPKAKLPESVEVRVIDLEKSDSKSIEEAVKGIEVFM